MQIVKGHFRMAELILSATQNCACRDRDAARI